MKANAIIVCAASMCTGMYGVSANVPFVGSSEVSAEVPKNVAERFNLEAVLPSEPEDRRRYPSEVRRRKDDRQKAVPSKSNLKKRNLKR